ncbi:MAG: TerB family tellurite resistance protein [Carboxylicivirga sp.]|jgi:DnaJ like chaperone protein|nr:TerB family tellurite resistance protein [Carboxylicivirga sp.]
MGLLGSLIGGSIGWWTLGSLGAIIGMVFGHLSEEQASFINNKNRANNDRSGFLATLLVLVAAVMKADQTVKKSELDYVKRSLVATFGEKEAASALLMLRDILKQDIPVNEVVHQARVNINYSSKLQLMHLLFGIALADKDFSKDERDCLQQIAIGLGVSQKDFSSVLAMFVKDNSSAYKILEVDKNASDDEIKKAYKKLAIRNHPDKVAHLGEDIRKKAEEKFKKVNEAFEQIKKERRIK